MWSTSIQFTPHAVSLLPVCIKIASSFEWLGNQRTVVHFLEEPHIFLFSLSSPGLSPPILPSDWYQRLLVKMIRATDPFEVVRLRMIGSVSLLPFTLHCTVLKLAQGLALYYSFLSEETFFLVGFLSNCDLHSQKRTKVLILLSKEYYNVEYNCEVAWVI